MRDRQDFEMGRQERALGDALRTRPSVGCPSAENLVAFVEGTLGEVARATIVDHLAQCSACRDTVFAMRAADRAAQPRMQGWRRYAPGFGLVGAMALLAGAVTIGFGVFGAPKRGDPKNSLFAINVTKQRADQERQTDHQATAIHEPVRTTPSSKPKKSAPSIKKTGSVGQGSHSSAVSKAAEQSGKPSVGAGRQTLVASNASAPPARAMKFFLVGQNHVFSLNAPDAKQRQRATIEQDYADNVAAYQAEYKRVIENGEDPVAAAEDLRTALRNAASDRDQRLAGLYQEADEYRRQQPELKVEGDAPYQVVGVNYDVRDSSSVVDSYVVYAPWPGYVSDEVPYGWQYGVVYSPAEFRQAYTGWHRTFVASGRAFCGLWGRSGAVQPDLVVRASGPRYGLNSVAESKYAHPRPASKYLHTLPHSQARYGSLGSGIQHTESTFGTGSLQKGPSRYSHDLGGRPATIGGAGTTGQDLKYRHDFGLASPSPSRRGLPPIVGTSKYNRGMNPPPNSGKSKYEKAAPSGESRYRRGSTGSGTRPLGSTNSGNAVNRQYDPSGGGRSRGRYR